MAAQVSFTKRFFRDSGNWPLIFANVVAVGFCGFFGGRKLFQHPDTFVERKDRDFGAIHTPERALDAEGFRKTTGSVAMVMDYLNKISTKVTGRHTIDISTYGNDIPPTPLEATDFFKDGAYSSVGVTEAPPTGEFSSHDFTEEDFDALAEQYESA